MTLIPALSLSDVLVFQLSKVVVYSEGKLGRGGGGSCAESGQAYRMVMIFVSSNLKMSRCMFFGDLRLPF